MQSLLSVLHEKHISVQLQLQVHLGNIYNFSIFTAWNFWWFFAKQKFNQSEFKVAVFIYRVLYMACGKWQTQLIAFFQQFCHFFFKYTDHICIVLIVVLFTDSSTWAGGLCSSIKATMGLLTASLIKALFVQSVKVDSYILEGFAIVPCFSNGRLSKNLKPGELCSTSEYEHICKAEMVKF